MTSRIIVGDCLSVMPTMDACSIDAIVCDPPYGLSFMGKDWDHGVPGAHFWIEALRVAKPGAHLIAFGGTRTHHRLMCAIEDAGWEIRDTLGWMYGSGFPKSHNGPWGGTALKPAWEPIVLARKPLAGTVAANVREYRTGALNIDGCRVEGVPGTPHNLQDGVIPTGDTTARLGAMAPASYRARVEAGEITGRWPANIIHDGSDAVVALFPDSDGQQGKSDDSQRSQASCFGAVGGNGKEYTPRGDSGSASRFFYCAKADREDRNAGLHYMPEVRRSDGRATEHHVPNLRTTAVANHHPTVKPTDLMRYLCRLVAPPGGLILDPFAGSGSTGKAALLEGFEFVGIELSPEYAEIARARIYATAPLFAQEATA